MPPSTDWLSWLWAIYVANRENIVSLITMIGGGIGIYFLAVRTRAVDRTARAALEQAKTAADQSETAAKRHQEQTSADRERRITESFAKAVEQLGSDKLETQLGGIYTLERIAGERARREYYWPIMEILTAYVREHAPFIAGEAPGESTRGEPENETKQASVRVVRPATDIQAVLTVLGRRDEAVRQQDGSAGRRLDLAAIDLRGADLAEAHLENAILWRAHLEGAVLWRAHLENANFRGADLKGANLFNAHLEGAKLLDAHLEGAILSRAHLEGAVLWRAHLENAKLGGAVGGGAPRECRSLGSVP